MNHWESGQNKHEQVAQNMGCILKEKEDWVATKQENTRFCPCTNDACNNSLEKPLSDSYWRCTNNEINNVDISVGKDHDSAHSVEEEAPKGAGKKNQSRKPYVMRKAREIWSEEEHERFVEALRIYRRDWKRIETYVGTKNVLQIRSHAQKYFHKVQKYQTGEYIPPPRPKRSHHDRQAVEKKEQIAYSGQGDKYSIGACMDEFKSINQTDFFCDTTSKAQKYSNDHHKFENFHKGRNILRGHEPCKEHASLSDHVYYHPRDSLVNYSTNESISENSESYNAWKGQEEDSRASTSSSWQPSTDNTYQTKPNNFNHFICPNGYCIPPVPNPYCYLPLFIPPPQCFENVQYLNDGRIYNQTPILTPGAHFSVPCGLVWIETPQGWFLVPNDAAMRDTSMVHSNIATKPSDVVAQSHGQPLDNCFPKHNESLSPSINLKNETAGYNKESLNNKMALSNNPKPKDLNIESKQETINEYEDPSSENDMERTTCSDASSSHSPLLQKRNETKNSTLCVKKPKRDTTTISHLIAIALKDWTE